MVRKFARLPGFYMDGFIKLRRLYILAYIRCRSIVYTSDSVISEVPTDVEWHQFLARTLATLLFKFIKKRLRHFTPSDTPSHKYVSLCSTGFLRKKKVFPMSRYAKFCLYLLRSIRFKLTLPNLVHCISRPQHDQP